MFLRRMDSLEEISLNFLRPTSTSEAWSPDGSAIAFTTLSGLIRMRLPSGPQVNIWPDAGKLAPRGMSWGTSGFLLLALKGSGPGLYMVPVAGGVGIRLNLPGLNDGYFYEPDILPNGEDFVFLWTSREGSEAGLYLATLKGGKVVRGPFLLRKNLTAGRYTPSAGGRLLYVEGNNLYAQKLNVVKGMLQGEPELVVEQVSSELGTRRAFFSVSRGGVLTWKPGTVELAQLTWFDRQGKTIGITGPQCDAGTIRLAPDEKHVLVPFGDTTGLFDSNRSSYTRIDGLTASARAG